MANPFAQFTDIANAATQTPPAITRKAPLQTAPPSIEALMSDAAGRVGADTGIQANVAPLPGWAQGLLKGASYLGYKPQGYTLGNFVYYNPPAFEGSNPTDMQDFLTHEMKHVQQYQGGQGMFGGLSDMMTAHDARPAEIEAEQAVRDRTHAGKVYRPTNPR